MAGAGRQGTRENRAGGGARGFQALLRAVFAVMPDAQGSGALHVDQEAGEWTTITGERRPSGSNAMDKRKDPVRLALRIILFAVTFLGVFLVSGPWLTWAFQKLAGSTFAWLFAALSASWLTLRVFEDVPLGAIGLWWNSASRRNLVLGLAGGAGVASLALVLPLATGAAVLVVRGGFEPGSVVFVFFCLAAGALAEEIIFRGYVLQVLVRGIGPWAAVIPLGVLFGLTHDFNPGANALGLLNTAGFGIAFGYAYLRSRDLWLPVGLHFAWNLTLVLFGTRLSGNTIFVTGREMTWRAGALWSGGEYGPEASILTSLALIPLFVFLWKAPIRRQYSPLMDPTRENAKCEPSPLPPS